MFLWCALSTDISRKVSAFVSEAGIASCMVLQPGHNTVSIVLWSASWAACLPLAALVIFWSISVQTAFCYLHVTYLIMSPKFLSRFFCIFKKVLIPFIFIVCLELYLIGLSIEKLIAVRYICLCIILGQSLAAALLYKVLWIYCQKLRRLWKKFFRAVYLPSCLL